MFPDENKNVYRMVITLLQYRQTFDEWPNALYAYEEVWPYTTSAMTKPQLKALVSKMRIAHIDYAFTEGEFFTAVGNHGCMNYGDAFSPFHEGPRQHRLSEWLGLPWREYDPIPSDGDSAGAK